MKLTDNRWGGYGPNCYIIDHESWHEMIRWLRQHEVEYWQVSSSHVGIGFQIKSNIEWFNLKWL
jgi:hypothetical protein